MRHFTAISIVICLAAFVACSPAGGERRGHEFMPDMVHTTGYEANLYDYYYYNRWGTEEEYKSYVMPRKTVPGTVARGQVSFANATDDVSRYRAMSAFDGDEEGAFAFTPNGSVPYYYQDSDAERIRATKEILRNPFPITEAGLEHGKQLYDIYCGICHGGAADGQGYLVREENPATGSPAGVYPAAPANLLQDTFINSSPGLIYHAIMYGKNVMGPYSDKLTYRERWEVIHYIRSLQAATKKMEYSATANTLNAESTPWSAMSASVEAGMRMQNDTATMGATQNGGHMQQNVNQH